MILCTWTGDAMVPAGVVWLQRATDRYTVGAEYMIDGQEPRSDASHNHYFAAVNEAFLNLPVAAAERFASSEHLRKFALIRTGYRDERSHVCASKAEAQRTAAFIKPMDDFAVVTVDGPVVTVFTAKSQSRAAMGGKVFQDSKEAVLAYLAAMIEVRPAALDEAGATHGNPDPIVHDGGGS